MNSARFNTTKSLASISVQVGQSPAHVLCSSISLLLTVAARVLTATLLRLLCIPNSYPCIGLPSSCHSILSYIQSQTCLYISMFFLFITCSSFKWPFELNLAKMLYQCEAFDTMQDFALICMPCVRNPEPPPIIQTRFF